MDEKNIRFEELPCKDQELSFEILHRKLKENIRIENFNQDTLKPCKIFASGDGRYQRTVEGKKEFRPQEIEEVSSNLELRQEKQRKMTEKMQRILSPERINTYVEAQLRDRQKLRASELSLASMDDFMKMIYIRLYGSRKKMCYRIEKSDKGNKIRMNFAESETV